MDGRTSKNILYDRFAMHFAYVPILLLAPVSHVGILKISYDEKFPRKTVITEMKTNFSFLLYCSESEELCKANLDNKLLCFYWQHFGSFPNKSVSHKNPQKIWNFWENFPLYWINIQSTQVWTRLLCKGALKYMCYITPFPRAKTAKCRKIDFFPKIFKEKTLQLPPKPSFR